MTKKLEIVPYKAWKPETITMEAVENLPWANQRIYNSARRLVRGLLKAKELGLPSQVNLYFANLKRLAKKSVSESIRQALESTGIVIEPKGSERMVKVEDYEGTIPTDMLDLMGLIKQMIPVAQFRLGVTRWRRDPYLIVGIPGGAWHRVGSWYRETTGHILIDAGKVDLEELLLGNRYKD